MSLCNGNGECIQQYDINKYSKKVCIYNCQLVQCHNFRLCNRKLPQQVLNCHNGMCSDCAIMLGKFTFLDKKDNCPICMENKDMIEISCKKHTVCLNCWIHMSEIDNRPHPLSCPLCRKSIWEWK